ncbi:MAG: M56 family metallopeptidase [Holophagales bacterium]|nr:M56 family metallopeptidase [Holophagales bacterium]MYG31018.1 M56 family metallopeptidase [Holophagales bacterium]MYI80142.1 M56 family metallopeptidase [Holophagales bacterium]
MTDLLATSGSFLVELAVRATLVLLGALALQWLTRKGAAATRHHLWTLTFALLLALPLLALAAPSWDVALLPSPDPPGEEEFLAPVVSLGPAEFTEASSGPLDVTPSASVAAKSSWRLFPLPLLIWAVGFGMAIVSVGVGVRRFRKLVHSAEPVVDLGWQRQLDAVHDELGFRSHVRLLLGGEGVTPMTGGLWHPIILLPASAVDWSHARRRMVLAHELVHVRRRDALRQLSSRVVLAFYWFHPLSWVASRLAAARREEACDEEVLAVGTRPSEYAGHLLSLAGSRASSRAVLSLPLVRRAQLERRIRAILRPNRARPRASSSAATLAVAAVAAVPVSVANPVSSSGASNVTVVEDSVLDCLSASDLSRLSGGEELDDLLPCLLETGTTSSRVPSNDAAEWTLLESEIRKQLRWHLVRAEQSDRNAKHTDRNESGGARSRQRDP